MPPASMTISYTQLLERVGHYLFGIRSGFSNDQIGDINDCIRDGLNRVYAIHHWSYLRPVVEISTTAPYSDGSIEISNGIVTLTGGTFPAWAGNGILKVGNQYFSVDSRNSNTQLTLTDLSINKNANTNYLLASPNAALPVAFEAISGDSDLTYYPDQTTGYPPVKQRPDVTIRMMEQKTPEFGRPMFYSLKHDQFDPVVGSRRTLSFFPTPDNQYILRVPMVLRPVMIDAQNPFPIGGEHLGQLFLEACLASAEHNFEEREHIHERRFVEMVPFAIERDNEHSSPTSLGRDGSYSIPRELNLWGRIIRLSNTTFNGDVL